MIDLVLRSVLTPGVLAARWAGIAQLPVTADVPATRWSIGLASKLILDEIDHLGVADNTLVIYASDQGFFLGEHGWFEKRWMYEESFSTPLMIMQRCCASITTATPRGWIF